MLSHRLLPVQGVFIDASRPPVHEVQSVHGLSQCDVCSSGLPQVCLQVCARKAGNPSAELMVSLRQEHREMLDARRTRAGIH